MAGRECNLFVICHIHHLVAKFVSDIYTHVVMKREFEIDFGTK